MTIFTEIIEGKLPGFIIFEDEHHVAILDKYPIDTGHSLVIPKKQEDGHIHIIPRYANKATMWTKRGIPKDDELSQLQQKIKDSF